VAVRACRLLAGPLNFGRSIRVNNVDSCIMPCNVLRTCEIFHSDSIDRLGPKLKLQPKPKR
jgi:hypothetical protein